MEAQGIPAVIVTRADFTGVVKNAVSGLGLAQDAAMVTFPIDMFLPGADLSALKTRKQEFYDGLTRWKSTTASAAATHKRMIEVEGATYEDAFSKANHYFLRNMLGDGMPLCPPTEERVSWIMRGTQLPRGHLLGKFPPSGGITTVETCAIALAMAGGRPEYLPVLIAAVDACFDPSLNVEQLQATSAGPFPVVIVNGPIAKQIRLNSGFSCLGPAPQAPAGASIGRALRLLQQNVGGALPAVGAMACFGGMRYTNVVFAEDEEGLPTAWQTHASLHHGYAAGTNSISLTFASGVSNIRRRGARKETPEQDALQGLYRIADYMRTPNMGSLKGYQHGSPGIVIIPRVTMRNMAALGWTQKTIREFLWEHSKIPSQHLARNGGLAWLEIDVSPVVRESLAMDPWPITAKPENIILLVAGGAHPTHAYWIQGHAEQLIGRKIGIPDNFNELLAASEQDLGTLSDTLKT